MLKDSPAQSEVFAALKAHGEEMKRGDIAEEIGRDPDSVSQALRGLRGRGLVEKTGHGWYDLADKPDTGKDQISSHEGHDLHLIPEVEVAAGPGREAQLEEVNGGFYVPEQYIRRVYGVRPEKLCVMRVVGDSMVDTLQPGQRVVAARWEGEKPRDGAIYGLHGPTGFMVKRLRFGREEGQDVIWIWSDNEDRGRWWVTMDEFEQEYTPLAWAIEVGKKL